VIHLPNFPPLQLPLNASTLLGLEGNHPVRSGKLKSREESSQCLWIRVGLREESHIPLKTLILNILAVRLCITLQLILSIYYGTQ
jgi:hypothetical protein